MSLYLKNFVVYKKALIIEIKVVNYLDKITILIKILNYVNTFLLKFATKFLQN